MRRLLLAASVLALVPAVPAHAGPAACVVARGFPVCAGTCSPSDPITVVGVSASGAQTAAASCGGGTASCITFRFVCTGSAASSGSGALSCGGSADIVVCTVGITAN